MNVATSQRSAKTRPAPQPSPYSRTDSSEAREGGVNSPAVINDSMAPLPGLVGINEQTISPQSREALRVLLVEDNAADVELIAHKEEDGSEDKSVSDDEALVLDDVRHYHGHFYAVPNSSYKRLKSNP